MSNEPRNYSARPLGWPTKALKSLNSVVVTGATGASVLRLPHPCREFTVQLDKLTTGATHASTKATIALQGKLSTGSTWFTLGSAMTITTTAAALTRSTNSKAVMFARLSVTSFTTRSGSTSPDKANVTGYIAPVFGA